MALSSTHSPRSSIKEPYRKSSYFDGRFWLPMHPLMNLLLVVVVEEYFVYSSSLLEPLGEVLALAVLKMVVPLHHPRILSVSTVFACEIAHLHTLCTVARS